MQATTPASAKPVLRTTDEAPEEEPLEPELELELDEVGAEETEVPLEGGAVAIAPTPPVLGPLSWIYGTLSEIYRMLPSGASLQSSRWSQSQLQPT